jgi:ADP-ribosylglycohydrolase
MKNDQRDTLRLLLTGLACGDSLGSTSEFVPQSQIPALYAKLKPKGWPFEQVGGGAFNWKPGEPTDDTDQAMCLVRSYVELGGFDPADVAKRLVDWLDSGPPDVGGTTARTLGRIRKGAAWHEAGLLDHAAHPHNAANGSLMRNGVLPGLLFGADLDLLFRATVQHSIITHAHPLAVLTCAVHSWIIADELSEWEQGPGYDPEWLDAFYEDWTSYVEGEDDPHVGAWLDAVRDRMQAAGEALSGAAWDPDVFNPFETTFAGRDGYCLLTLQIAVWALLWSKSEAAFPVPAGFPLEVFERRGPWCIAWPAIVGHDADTYGAVAGPVLAAGHRSLPTGITDGLTAAEEFDILIGVTGYEQ